MENKEKKISKTNENREPDIPLNINDKIHVKRYEKNKSKNRYELAKFVQIKDKTVTNKLLIRVDKFIKMT